MKFIEKNETRYQIALIALGLISTVLFIIFFGRELFPEYKIYQERFIELERFRADLHHVKPAPFQTGIKQLVFEREDKGPAAVDRCVSCHVALQIPDYSPKEAYLDEAGVRKIRDNPNYIYNKLDGQGLESLKTISWEGHIYETKKVLTAHPLIGEEMRPFQFHPLEEYGCTVCHGGNGNGLTTEKAHGPVEDGTYEEEFTGKKPQFLERDPENDPPFSRFYNHKPGHKLLFQTTPLLEGVLIEAKCAQCHLTALQEHEIAADYWSEILAPPKEAMKESKMDALLSHYIQGEQLFFSQGCYACHRIAGLSRGGVGPELTKEGFSYPWFVKESIVWPQADLKTSTMPNFHLDHPEIEDLMTFLLAQRGERKAFSGMAYKKNLTAWENGKKRDFEKPIDKKEIDNLDFGMRLFAEGGCAACHRLEGYSSEVGVSKDKEALAWFKSHFKQDVKGKELVRLLDQYQSELDRYIVARGDTRGVLDTLEQEAPGLVASFYTPFKYAERAKNHLLHGEALDGYKARLKKVLFAFVEVYGLGRQIAPLLNWSGVYRSDLWLMQHFFNPGIKVPRSIMPVFPYDITKFYALTFMLNRLAEKNLSSLHKEWETSGFQPSVAYMELCSQCHGETGQANGPVSNWIYPVPKNLRNGEFMRNLTREKASESILHGVPGTPMPPWGEVAVDKKGRFTTAVLTESQTNELVDWLYAFIPGEKVIRGKEDVPRWQYGAKQIEEELSNSSIFDQEEKPTPFYRIKKSLYTKENIEAGRTFFMENCAVCHGNDADGQSLRAEAMQDAKPRMLTNENWLLGRDDVRLLGSIKYGVAGTSMTPWGDLTTPEIRLQLVIFIHSLVEEKVLRAQLQEALFRRFDVPGSSKNDKAKNDKERAILQSIGQQIMMLLPKSKEILFPLFIEVIEKKSSSDLLIESVQEEIVKANQALELISGHLPSNERKRAEKAEKTSIQSLQKLKASIETLKKVESQNHE